jgi:tetratricopeptide (TPR) repeat protein
MYKGAIEFYKKAREVFPDLEGDELEVVAYEWLGDNHLQIGQYKESIECYNEIVKLASQLGNKKREINAYFGLGSAFSNTGDFESSEKYFLKALTMTGQDNDKSLQREVHIKLGHVYYESGKFDTALKSYLRAQEISLDLGTRKDKGNPYLTLVQEISPDLGKKKDEANIYFMLGNTFQQLKEEEKAIESYQRAIDISKELKDEEMQVIAEQRLGTSCLNLALVCSENGEHEASVKWYKKALDIFGTELNDHVLRRKALTGLAVAWFNLGYTEKAIKSIQEAKNISEKEYNTGIYFDSG